MMIFLLILCLIKLNPIESHGKMINPPQRGSMWRFGFDVVANYNDMSNYCGGFVRHWDKNGGKCGVCGDPWDQNPRDHEPGGQYATGKIGKTYHEGQIINITVDITANHYGYFEFRLCQNDEFMKAVTQECFDKHLLLINENNEKVKTLQEKEYLEKDLDKYKYFVKDKGNAIINIKATLPKGITCRHCVIQWKYHSANRFGDKVNNKAVSCLGCSDKQEEFYNCADVEILGSHNKDNNEIIEIYNKSNRLYFNFFIFVILVIFFIHFVKII